MSFTALATSTQVAADAGSDASQRLSYVIIGLVVLAVVIAVVTIVFWRLTRPEPVAADAGIRWVPDPAAAASPTGSAAAVDPSTDR